MRIHVILYLVINLVILNQISYAKRYGGGGTNRGNSRRTGTNYGVSKNRAPQTGSAGQTSHTSLASLSYAGYNQKIASKPQPKPSAPELPHHQSVSPVHVNQAQNSRPIGWNVDGNTNINNAQHHGLPKQNTPIGHSTAQGLPPPYAPNAQEGPPPYSPNAHGVPPRYSPQSQAYLPHAQGLPPAYTPHAAVGNNPNQQTAIGHQSMGGYSNVAQQANQGMQINSGYQPRYSNQGVYGGMGQGNGYGYQGFSSNTGFGGNGGYPTYPGNYGNRGASSSFLGFGSGLGIGSIVTGLALWSFARGSHSNNLVHVYDSRTGESSNITSLTHPCIADIVNGTNATSVTVILAPNCTFVSQEMQGSNNFTIDTAEAQKEILHNGAESVDLSQIGLGDFNVTGINLVEVMSNETNLLHLNTQFNMTNPHGHEVPHSLFLSEATELTDVDDAPKDIKTLNSVSASGVQPLDVSGNIMRAEAGKDATEAQFTKSASSYASMKESVIIFGLTAFLINL